MFTLERPEHRMVVSLIAAVSKEMVIGNGNKIPWKSKEDMEYFKQTTMGKPVIMGRSTWDSIGKPLKGRMNFVITRNEKLIGLASENEFGPIFMPDLTSTITMLEDNKVEECFIIGGQLIYEDAIQLDLVDQMFINVMKFDGIKGDRYFPYIEPSRWEIEKSVTRFNDFDAYLYIRNRFPEDEKYNRDI